MSTAAAATATSAAVRVEAGAPSASATVATATPVEAGAVDEMQMFDEAITMLETVAGIVQANMRDCKVMGDKLEAYHHQHADFVTRVGHVYDAKRGADLKAIQAHFRERFHAAWRKISPGMMKCKEDPNVKKVMHAAWGDTEDPPIQPPQDLDLRE